MNDVVLDASALLALLNEEPGSEIVEESLADAVIGAVNLSEALAKLSEIGLDDDVAWDVVSSLALTVVDFDLEAASTTARLRKPTRAKGLSLGDRACLALGRNLDAPVLTADRSWNGLKLGIEIRPIR